MKLKHFNALAIILGLALLVLSLVPQKTKAACMSDPQCGVICAMSQQCPHTCGHFGCDVICGKTYNEEAENCNFGSFCCHRYCTDLCGMY